MLRCNKAYFSLSWRYAVDNILNYLEIYAFKFIWKSRCLFMKINANGTEISVILSDSNQNGDYISLTDIAKYKNRENAF